MIFSCRNGDENQNADEMHMLMFFNVNPRHPPTTPPAANNPKSQISSEILKVLIEHCNMIADCRILYGPDIHNINIKLQQGHIQMRVNSHTITFVDRRWGFTKHS